MNSNREHVLDKDTVLDNRYQVKEVLGEGGFGVTYVALDMVSQQKVALKEYFPKELSYRIPGEQDIHVFKGDKSVTFQKGMEHFLREAEILVGVGVQQGVAGVLRCFEENATAYLVMEYIEGITLLQYIEDNGHMELEEMNALFAPVLDSLIKLHEKGVIHRDISPDNLLVGLDNQLHLIDFGAAFSQNQKTKKNVTVILKKGFAPLEQYISDGKLGPWTDVYGLCATMYYAITGMVPVDVLSRMQGRALAPVSSIIGNVESFKCAAIERGMELSVGRRFRNISELKMALEKEQEPEDMVTMYGEESSKEILRFIRKMNVNRNRKYFAVTAIICVVFLVGTVFLFGGGSKQLVEYRDEDTMTGVAADEKQDTEGRQIREETGEKGTSLQNGKTVTEEQTGKVNMTEAITEARIVKQSLKEKPQNTTATSNMEGTDSVSEPIPVTENTTENTTEVTAEIPTEATTQKPTTEDPFVINEDDEYEEFELGE